MIYIPPDQLSYVSVTRPFAICNVRGGAMPDYSCPACMLKQPASNIELPFRQAHKHTSVDYRSSILNCHIDRLIVGILHTC